MLRFRASKRRDARWVNKSRQKTGAKFEFPEIRIYRVLGGRRKFRWEEEKLSMHV